MRDKLLSWFYLKRHPEGAVPEKVIGGTFLLYIAMVLQMISNLIEGINLSAFIFLFGFLFYFIFMTGEGKKWARLLVLIIIILNLPYLSYFLYMLGSDLYIKSNYTIKGHVPFYIAIIFSFLIVSQIWAMFLLFSKETKPWFNRERKVVS